MSRLKIVFILSLVILGVLIAFTIFRPMVTGSEYSEVQRAQLLETENEYIVEFDIINHNGRDTTYTIKVLIDNYQYSQDILIPDGKMFTYTHHIYPHMITEGNASFTIYKEGEATPFEEAIYHLE